MNEVVIPTDERPKCKWCELPALLKNESGQSICANHFAMALAHEYAMTRLGQTDSDAQRFAQDVVNQIEDNAIIRAYKHLHAATPVSVN
jgi:hypothetical protein